MKRLIFAISVMALVGCHKEKFEYTSVEVTATDASTGLPIDSVEFYVTKNGINSDIQDIDFTQHGHCRLSFEASNQAYYSLSYVGDYEVVNNDFVNYISNGGNHSTQAILAERSLLQIDIQNVNYIGTSEMVQFRLSPLNSSYNTIEIREAFWNYYSGGIQASNFIENYATYDLPAVDYLMEWKLSGSSYVWSDTLSVQADTLNVYTLAY